MSNLYSVGQMNQLGDALEKVGFTPDEVTKLRQFDLGAVRSVLAGYSEIKPIEHVINCDADPFTPSGWTVESHTKGGQFVFDPAKIKLYLSPNQQDSEQDSEVIEGNKLRKELANELVLNANVLDYLLKNPQLIPEDWKKDEKGNTRFIFFWGTIYRGSSGGLCGLCVRCLCFSGGRWHWDYDWLGSDWSGHSPAALRAS